MKNANEKYIEYARVIQMCKGTKFENEPWKCIRRADDYVYESHPGFGSSYNLEFAVAIVEDEPVFVGDKVYWKIDEREFCWADGLITVDKWDDRVTRTPPKRTFMLNGEELPCPSLNGRFSFGFTTDAFKFDSEFDAIKVRSAIKRILEEVAK